MVTSVQAELASTDELQKIEAACLKFEIKGLPVIEDSDMKHPAPRPIIVQGFSGITVAVPVPVVRMSERVAAGEMLASYKGAFGILAACFFQSTSAFAPTRFNGLTRTATAARVCDSSFVGLRRFASASQSRVVTDRRGCRSGQIQMVGSGENDVPVLERFIACLPYALPLSDAFEWGHYLFDKFPLLAIPFIPLFPVIRLLNTPFVSFGVFIVLFSFVTRNPSFSRFIRYNTLQAIYLDIVLIFPQILKSFNLGGPVPVELAEVGSNTVFYAITLAILYSSFCNLGGKLPNDIPLISESVDSQLPF